MAMPSPSHSQPLTVPDTDLKGVDADQVFNVTAADVVGYLGETGGASEHRLLLVHRPGRHLDRLPGHVGAADAERGASGTPPTDYNQGPFDTYLVIFNSSGQVIEYNDNSFQDADSSIIDLTLPYTGTYYAMVTSSPNSVSLHEPLTGDYELFMYTFAPFRTRRPAIRSTPARATTQSSPARPTTRSPHSRRTRSATGREP